MSDFAMIATATVISLAVSAPCLIKAIKHALLEAHHHPKKEPRP